MSFLARAAATAFLVMLAYHLVTATGARILGLSFDQAVWLELGVYSIHLAAGLLAARASGRMRTGVAVALAAGLADGVLGWRITAAIFQTMRIVFDHDGAEVGFAMEMLVISGVFGSVGALIGSLLHRFRRRSTKPSF